MIPACFPFVIIDFKNVYINKTVEKVSLKSLVRPFSLK